MVEIDVGCLRSRCRAWLGAIREGLVVWRLGSRFKQAAAKSRLAEL